MKSFIIKLSYFFWSWGFLKFILWTVTLVIFFYVEEDWRGARAWAATKAKWEAQGESFDYSKFIPPPIPDDQNLAAIPLFKLVETPPGDPDQQPIALQRAMRSNLPGNDLPSLGSYQRGESPDWNAIRSGIAVDYSTVFPGTTQPADTLAQFEALYPFISDLRAATHTRPLCRFNVDYTISPPFSRSLGLIVAPIRLTKILALHALLALHQQRSDIALEDIKINYKLATAAGRDPTLIGALVALGVNAITQPAIYDGLAMHAWSDAQLEELQATLNRVDFLAEFPFAFRSEAAETILNLDGVKNTPRFQVLGLEQGIMGYRTIWGEPWNHIPFLWPSGWWDQNKSLMPDFELGQLATVDPSSHRAFPDVDRNIKQRLEINIDRWDATAPWRFWFTMAASPLVSQTQKFAYGQTWVDEACIACALERYRLAHGVYPDSLDALAPAYIDSLPHEVITGQPYHYRLRPDGIFLLYSVGWNQTDDGGKIAYKTGYDQSLKQIDYDQGDWVWPTPQFTPNK
jgi:hypothetical protein